MKSRAQLGSLAGIAALLCALAFAPDCAQAQAQRRKPVARPRAEKQRKAPPPDAAQKGNAQQRTQGQQQFRPGQFDGPGPRMDRLRQMPPERQEQFLRNNPWFQNQPPERQAQIRQNLRRWNSMTPDQQREVLRREEVWRQMSPEQRQRVREELMPRWEQLEPQRRQQIMRRMRALRDMNDEQRAAKLNDEAFLSGLSNDDRELLRELSKLRLPPPEPHEPPDDSPLL